MSDEHRRYVRVVLQGLAYLLRVGHVAVRELEFVDAGAVGRGDLEEAIAEVADGDAEDALAGGERVDDGGLHRSGAGGGEDVEVVLGLEGALEVGGRAAKHVGELDAAVVDHLLAHRLIDFGRNGRGAGQAQVGHGSLLSGGAPSHCEGC